MARISVTIPTAAQWPSQEEMQRRDRIMEQFERQVSGDFIGSGGGRGAVDFAYDVPDVAQAQRMLEEILTRELAGASFKIEHV
jgi:hypothetical protein